MKMILVLQEEVKISLKEIEEETNKKLEERWRNVNIMLPANRQAFSGNDSKLYQGSVSVCT